MPNKNRGFTLVELLLVIVIIGLLAAIAGPKFSNTKEKAYQVTMRGDLRNLAVAQEAYFFDNSTYYVGAIPSPLLTHDPSSGVTLTLQNVTGMGWAATATHVGTGKTCTLFHGAAPPLPPAVVDGETACG